MANETNLLQEAIASAKQVRAAAIQNAYKSLEENLTPSIKAMLEGKLEEELDLDENEEESIEEAANSGFKEVKAKAAPKAKVNEAEEDDQAEEEPDGDEDGGEATGDHAEPDGDEPEEDAEAAEDDAEAAEADAEAAEADAQAADDDTKLEDLTLGDLKALVADLVGQLQAAPAPEGNEGVDMEPAADVQGQGEEDVPIEGEPEAPVDGGAEPEEGNPAAEEDDNEIDLAELLKELEAEERDRKVVTHSQDKELAEVKRALAESRKENKEAINVISELRNTMTDVNLLNAKLVYTNRMLAQNLSESQKAKVIKSFDGAKSPAEVKTIYKTLTESFGIKEGNKATVLKEHRSYASRSAGKSTAAPATNIVEVNPVVKRFQQLAGIID